MTAGQHSHRSAADTAAEPLPGRRRLPRRFWLIVALQVFLMLCTMVLYPSFQSPDEGAHVDYVLAHRNGQWLDAPGTRHYQAGVLAAQGLVPGTQFREHVGGTKPLERSARPSFDELGTGSSNSPFTNQMTQHPPLYYGLAAGFSYLLPNFSHHRFDVQVFWLRLFSLLLLLPVPFLIFGTARRVTGSQTVALVAALLPLSIPSYLRTGASVSNDSLLLLATTVAVALLARVAFGDLGRRTAVLLGLAWTAALLTKGFALSLPPAIVLAYLVGASGSLRQRIALAWRPVVIAGALGAVLGGWWWVRNLLKFHAVQPNGLGKLPDNLRQLILGPDRTGGTELRFFENFFPLLAKRIWGSLGLIDIPSLPVQPLRALAVLLLLAMLASVVLGLAPLRSRWALLSEPDWTSARAISLLLPPVLTLVVMYGGARSVYLHGRQLPGIQVRYLLPSMLGLLICVAVVLCWLSGRFVRWLPPALITLTLLFIAGSAYRVLDIEMSGTSTSRRTRLDQALHFVIGWSPLPTVVNGALLVLTGLVVLAALAGFWWGAWREPGVTPSAPVRSLPPEEPAIAAG